MSKVVSTSQITITDQNDYIFTGTTPPLNPIVGLTLWIDTSVNPNQLKRWTGSVWEIVNNIQVGGTNLLPNSSFEDGFNGWMNHGAPIAQNSSDGFNGGKCLYLPKQSNYDGLQLQGFVCDAGQAYTFSCMVKVIQRGSSVSLGWNDNSLSAIKQQLATIPLNQWQKVHITFTGTGVAGTFYLISNGYEVYVDQAKLEKGNHPTDWSPSPNDVIKTGGRNLLLNSGIPFTSGSYLLTSYTATSLVPNQKYTVVIKASMSAGQNLSVYWNGGSGNAAVAFSRVEGPSVYYAHVTTPSTLTYQAIYLFNMPNTGAQATIYYACLYEGHISPPIDWSPAPEDVFGRLDEISSDNKLTPDEKHLALKEWQAIQGEFSSIQTQADIFGVSRTVYDATYSALNSYINPLLRSLTSTSDIVGSTFRNKFNDYYTARTNLLLAISQKQKDDLDNLEIGGGNLSLHNHYILAANSWESYKYLLVKGYQSTQPVSQPDTYLVNGRTYVFSIGKIRLISGNASQVRFLLYDFTSNSDSHYHILNVSESRQQYQFTVPSVGYWCLLLYAGMSGATQNNTVEFVDIMLQEGNKATSFTPATKYLTEAFKGSTEIQGGIVNTNLLLMKNSAEEITGGFSGLSSDNVGLWTGGTYNEALNSLSKVLFRKDGSGQLAGGNISWDTIGNMTMKGIIEALGGKMGGFSIQSNSLSTMNMSFSDSPVEALSSLLSPSTVSFYSQSSWYQSGLSAHAYTQYLYLSFDAQIAFKVTTTAQGDDLRWRVEIINQDSQVVFIDAGVGVITQKLYTVNLSVGTYTIHVYSMSTPLLPLVPVNTASIEGAVQSYYIQATGYVNQTKIGNNGLYSFWSNMLYFYLSSSHGLEIKGTTNMPGVLASGSISSVGGHTNYWGAKINSSNASYTSTGIYDVPHFAGSTYQVMIQPTIDNVRASVTSKGYNNFRVQIRTNSGTATMGSFDYVIVGSN